MSQVKENKPGLFRKLLKKYDDFCQELGVDQGACRSCVPIYKQDPEPEKKAADKEKNA
ncbi:MULTISPECIES: DUF5363 family protein [Gallibacterium]|uniref:DUF5363 family protein n=1 Tax=Gallibacterium TaxID=155493 RepID=UPI000A3E2CE8|nr:MULTISPECIES: DUF5363 family protein [Gallibacterium]MDA3977824.1 DUF5363 family protein [Gallibacterium sp. AGMB14963]